MPSRDLVSLSGRKWARCISRIISHLRSGARGRAWRLCQIQRVPLIRSRHRLSAWNVPFPPFWSITNFFFFFPSFGDEEIPRVRKKGKSIIRKKLELLSPNTTANLDPVHFLSLPYPPSVIVLRQPPIQYYSPPTCRFSTTHSLLCLSGTLGALHTARPTTVNSDWIPNEGKPPSQRCGRCSHGIRSSVQ